METEVFDNIHYKAYIKKSHALFQSTYKITGTVKHSLSVLQLKIYLLCIYSILHLKEQFEI